jgi:hypothetical protein
MDLGKGGTLAFVAYCSIWGLVNRLMRGLGWQLGSKTKQSQLFTSRIINNEKIEIIEEVKKILNVGILVEILISLIVMESRYIIL